MGKRVILLLCLCLIFYPGWAVTKTALKTSELMKPITDHVSANYSGYSITEAFKVNNNGTITYEVYISGPTQKLYLYYDDEGRFLRKELGLKTRSIQVPRSQNQPKPNPNLKASQPGRQ